MALVIVFAALLPVALLLGMALPALSVRRSVAALPGSFRCKVRADREPVAGLKLRWQHTACRGVWVHDALLVASGFWRVRVQALAVHFAEGALESASVSVVRGLGPDPVMLSLQLDDGGHALLAAPRSARAQVGGPYLVAQLASSHAPPH